jgi:hypothetical protein
MRITNWANRSKSAVLEMESAEGQGEWESRKSISALAKNEAWYCSTMVVIETLHLLGLFATVKDETVQVFSSFEKVGL